MTVRYRVDLEDATGTTVASFQTFNSLSFTKKISDRGSYQLHISGFDTRKALFGDDYLVRVWTDDVSEGITWVNVFNGIHKSYVDSVEANGQKVFTSFGPSLEELLDKSYIQYKAGSTGAAKSGNASTVMYEYVTENIGASATVANGRIVNGTNPITNAPDLSVGPSWSGSNAYRNLLNTLKKIRQYSIQQSDQIDFRINYLGGYAFQFEAGDIGTDRTTNGITSTSNGKNGAGNVPVIFGVLYGNVMEFSKSQSRMNEANAITALGQGDTDERQTVTVTDALSIATSPIAQRELITNANNIEFDDTDVLTELTTVANAKLDEKKGDLKFNFNPKKGAQILFRDYFTGDFVTGEDEDGNRQNKQIVEIQVNVSATEEALIERIRVRFDDK